MSHQEQPKWVEVDRVKYCRHKKLGKPDSVREDWQKAKYYIDMIEEEISRRMDG